MSSPDTLDAAALDALARDFTPVSADEAQSFLAHARKDFRSEANELGYVPVQPHDLERLSLTILALIAQARAGGEDRTDAERWRYLLLDAVIAVNEDGETVFVSGLRPMMDADAIEDPEMITRYIDAARAARSPHPETPHA